MEHKEHSAADERLTTLALEVQAHCFDYFDGKLSGQEWLTLVVDAVQTHQAEQRQEPSYRLVDKVIRESNQRISQPDLHQIGSIYAEPNHIPLYEEGPSQAEQERAAFLDEHFPMPEPDPDPRCSRCGAPNNPGENCDVCGDYMEFPPVGASEVQG